MWTISIVATLALTACGGVGSNTPDLSSTSSPPRLVETPSDLSGSAPSNDSLPSNDSFPPSFVEAKQAIESTGITLCDLSQAGNLRERIFGQSSTGECPEPGGGLIRIWTEDDVSSAQSDVQAAKTMGGVVWQDQAIVVEDEAPPPGLDSALAQLGFTEM